MTTSTQNFITLRDEKNRVIAILERSGLDYSIYKCDTAAFDEVTQILSLVDGYID